MGPLMCCIDDVSCYLFHRGLRSTSVLNSNLRMGLLWNGKVALADLLAKVIKNGRQNNIFPSFRILNEKSIF